LKEENKMVRIGRPRLAKAATGADGGGGAAKVSWRTALRTRTNLAQEGVHVQLQAALKPAYAAAKAAFNALPLATRLNLAEITHNEGYFKPSVLAKLGPEGIYAAPAMEAEGTVKYHLTNETAGKLKALLTPEGQEQVDNMISGQHADKAFVTPAQILEGKEAKFLAFFGKTSQAAAERIAQLRAEGKKTKILNNLYMSWGLALAFVDRFYTDQTKNVAMKEMLLGLQFEAVADSAIIMAALDSGVIAESDKYVAMHEAWATHNHWGEWGHDPQAVVNFRDLPRDAQVKDETILDTHVGMRQNLATVIDAIKVLDWF